MVGAFLYYIIVERLRFPWFAGFFVALLGAGFLGVGYDKFALRPLRRAGLPKFTALISTIGIATVFQNVIFLTMGSETRLFPTFFDGRYFTLGGANILYIQLLIVSISVICLLLLTLFLKKTRGGMAMRAVAQNSEAAECMGIDSDRVIATTFFLGSALAALSGILSCMSFRGIDMSIGTIISIKAFAATVLGGVGNLPGAVLGSFIISIAEILTAGYISSNIRDMSAFIMLIAILLFRPTGLLGRPSQKKV
jgi:branched-chain amino acid transport system permease protein